MNLIHEVDYLFEFEGHTYLEHHYVDNIVGLRYRLAEGYPEDQIEATNTYGTGDPFQVIRPTLLGSVEIRSGNSYEEHSAYFHLPDIDKIALIFIRIYDDGSKPVWIYRFSPAYYHNRTTLNKPMNDWRY